MSGPRTLQFWFDYISHNAYLAWMQLPALAARHGLTVEPIPVVFGAMLSHYGQVGPAELPAKSRWMLWNVLRKARTLGIPIAPPASHPFNPLLPLRASCCTLTTAQRSDLVGRLFRATWAEGRAVSEPAVVEQVLREAGLPAGELMAQAASEPVKLQLRRNTDEALAAGVFGVPTLRVDGELFWGFDDFEWLEKFLSGHDPLPRDRGGLEAWTQIRPSVQRKKA
ncbi:MAG TPA: 2-hydroxychromene-2-carboxylate isomerase [Candidatus Binatia bacterium]|nr:2-hydroxychromene-2-carboxylate isomerase [Candidatus Binatia bacterium]